LQGDKKSSHPEIIGRISFKDRELVEFGDQCNDLKMFQIAHRRVTVYNAIEELKHLATTITASNQHEMW